MSLIALCGWGGTGKDAVSGYMTKYERFSFADQIKADCLPLIRKAGFDLPKDKQICRPLLEAWGDLACENNPFHWVECLPDGNIVVTDLRRLIEADYVTARGGKIIRLHRKGVKPSTLWEERLIAEIDEKYPNLPNVHNDGTPEECAEKILAVASS